MNEDEIKHRFVWLLATYLDHPSIFMEGPTARNRRRASEILELLDDEGLVLMQKHADPAIKEKALEDISKMTSADDPDNYRADDPHGCLDAVHSLAVMTLRRQVGENNGQ